MEFTNTLAFWIVFWVCAVLAYPILVHRNINRNKRKRRKENK